MIKEVVVLSGKGGTGKTSLTAAFASLADHPVLCDADVDAADLHLLTDPQILQKTDFIGGNKAVIDPDRCAECGTCIELCHFNAIEEDLTVNPLDCEGCGVCYDLCPEHAIDFPETTCGEWYISDSRFGPIVHAKLGIAQENSGKLVALVRQEARKLCREKGMDFIITDGPPGIGCPVIASISQATVILIVAEPTVSGVHDLGRLLELADHFKVPAMVCINKFDLNLEQTEKIETMAEKRNITVLGNIPFDPVFIDSMVQGKTVTEYNEDCRASIAVKEIWANALKDMTTQKTLIT